MDQARESFHCQREWLEARFMTALNRIDPAEGARWEDARWHDEVLWARDRQTRHFLALVCVHFDANPFDPLAFRPAGHGRFRVPQEEVDRHGETARRDPSRRGRGAQSTLRARRDRSSQPQARGLIDRPPGR